MNERIKKLIAVGASVGANCHPCLEFHVVKALEMGIDREEIEAAVEVGKVVRRGAAGSMDKLALNLVRDRPSAASCSAGACSGSGCCS
ncbi:MAG: carboxymuconolactone decarboxylase family protein [Syntrophaceae bacterium]|nr:carboxymuconolactone decarboxylase family protein [Syntrophaceae bacterium]